MGNQKPLSGAEISRAKRVLGSVPRGLRVNRLISPGTWVFEDNFGQTYIAVKHPGWIQDPDATRLDRIRHEYQNFEEF